ncbi:torsin-1A-interacting protein 2 isoform X2 [Ictalurus furcatus]|uniref:torsin-1A-interacting protein 2 isoform X2 n=1 Tax=Ictalurus furcatus TaxID=66913 RepID=UPI00235021F2|nr:torsin-1A-interacting protein 2 isoform X2 [Ictalurus furcatus]
MNGQDTDQPEDTDTRVHNQQKANKKDTAGVRGQSDAEREDLDKLDGKCIKGKNENDDVPHAGESPRLRRSNEKQKIGGDADSGNSEEDDDEEEEVECYTDDDERSQEEDCGVTSSEINQSVKSPQKKHVKRQDTEQPEDTDTRVHNQQKANKKDTAGVRGQSDAEREDLDKLDGKCIKGKNESDDVPHPGEGPRLRRSNEKQKIAHLGEGDVRGHVETKKSPTAADTSRWYISFFLLALVGVVVVLWFLSTSSPPLQKQFNLLEVFCQEMDKVKASFPSQHRELWRRSRIHLQKHLNLTDPTEPVSLILTSGRAAEKTLGCLAHQLAAAFSNALNSSVLGIDGSSKSEDGSDQVKLDIDKALKEAFEGGTQAAVIHRFEELPPGSTLIFYRYCDHENSAFKKVFLAFTVMLQKEMDFPPNVSLGLVEEVVQEYLTEKFVSSEKTAKFNQMDLDKLSGLWSRISHLILPVTAEQKIEQHGCQT